MFSSKTIKPINNNDGGKNTVFFKPVIQAKLDHGAPGDNHEREANNIAQQVVRNTSVNKFFTGGASPIQKKLQRKPGEDVVTSPTIIHDVLSTGGQKMDQQTKTFMESSFGYDFENVQIHHDTKANDSSSQLNAMAYTHGNHVVFGAGQYQPHTDKGKLLLAHELTHVVQQGTQPGFSSGSIQRQTAEEENDNPILNIINLAGEAASEAITSVGDVVSSAVKHVVCSAGSASATPLTNPMSDVSTFQSPGASGWFGAKFGCFRSNCTRRHRGWDIHAPVGTSIFAVVSGNVRRHSDPGGYGDYLHLTSDADNTIVYRYAHLSSRMANGHYCVGDKIGETGITGNADANRPHLHLEVLNNNTQVDPVAFFTEPVMVVELLGTAAAVIDKTIPATCAPC